MSAHMDWEMPHRCAALDADRAERKRIASSIRSASHMRNARLRSILSPGEVAGRNWPAGALEFVSHEIMAFAELVASEDMAPADVAKRLRLLAVSVSGRAELAELLVMSEAAE